MTEFGPIKDEEIVLRVVVQHLNPSGRVHETAFEQLLERIDRLSQDQRNHLFRSLEFQFWDWNLVQRQLEEKHVAQNLLPPNEEEIESELRRRRNPQALESLHGNLIGILKLLGSTDETAEKEVEDLLRKAANTRTGNRELTIGMIVSQALAGMNWREACAPIMAVSGITADEIERELQKRN